MPTATKKLIEENGLFDQEQIFVITINNFSDICNVVRKSRGMFVKGDLNRR